MENAISAGASAAGSPRYEIWLLDRRLHRRLLNLINWALAGVYFIQLNLKAFNKITLNRSFMGEAKAQFKLGCFVQMRMILSRKRALRYRWPRRLEGFKPNSVSRNLCQQQVLASKAGSHWADRWLKKGGLLRSSDWPLFGPSLVGACPAPGLRRIIGVCFSDLNLSWRRSR